jgi:hypothetical protein
VEKFDNVQDNQYEDDTVIKKFLENLEIKPLTNEEIERSMSDEFNYLDDD